MLIHETATYSGSYSLDFHPYFHFERIAEAETHLCIDWIEAQRHAESPNGNRGEMVWGTYIPDRIAHVYVFSPEMKYRVKNIDRLMIFKPEDAMNSFDLMHKTWIASSFWGPKAFRFSSDVEPSKLMIVDHSERINYHHKTWNDSMDSLTTWGIGHAKRQTKPWKIHREVKIIDFAY